MEKKEFDQRLKDFNLSQHKKIILEKWRDQITTFEKLQKIHQLSDGVFLELDTGFLKNMIKAYDFNQDKSKEIGKWLVKLCDKREYFLYDFFTKIVNLDITKEDFNQILKDFNLNQHKKNIFENLADQIKNFEELKKIYQFFDGVFLEIDTDYLKNIIKAYNFDQDESKKIGKWLFSLIKNNLNDTEIKKIIVEFLEKNSFQCLTLIKASFDDDALKSNQNAYSKMLDLYDFSKDESKEIGKWLAQLYKDTGWLNLFLFRIYKAIKKEEKENFLEKIKSFNISNKILLEVCFENIPYGEAIHILKNTIQGNTIATHNFLNYFFKNCQNLEEEITKEALSNMIDAFDSRKENSIEIANWMVNLFKSTFDKNKSLYCELLIKICEASTAKENLEKINSINFPLSKFDILIRYPESSKGYAAKCYLDFFKDNNEIVEDMEKIIDAFDTSSKSKEILLNIHKEISDESKKDDFLFYLHKKFKEDAGIQKEYLKTLVKYLNSEKDRSRNWALRELNDIFILKPDDSREEERPNLELQSNYEFLSEIEEFYKEKVWENSEVKKGIDNWLQKVKTFKDEAKAREKEQEQPRQ